MNEYTEIISQIKPKNGRNFAIADVNDLKGGYIQVDTVNEMQAFLLTNKLKVGMLCYVRDTTSVNHIYQYNGVGWIEWGGQGGTGEGGSSLIVVEFLTDLENEDLRILGQLVFINEISELRYFNGLVWESFSRIYIQNTPPEDKGGIWIDTSEDRQFLDSNGVIQNLLQVIAVLQTKVAKLEWALSSQLDFGDFHNNHFSEYDGQLSEEPDLGSNEESDLETLIENLAQEAVLEEEPVTSLVPNGTHLCIKSGTYAEMQANKGDFLPKELLWCYDTRQLWIKDPRTLTLVQITPNTGDTPDDIYMEQIITEVVGTTTKITGIEFADMTDKSLTYLVQVKDGQLVVHDKRLDVSALAANAQVATVAPYYSTTYFPILATETGNTTSPMIYINMVYCGADSTSKSYNPCSHNFIELANLTDKDLNLKGLYLHYTERNTNQWVSLPLYGVLPAKGTFVIRGAQSSFIDVNTTYIKVSAYDMEWTKSATYNSDILDVAGAEAHSIWNAEDTIRLASNCALHLSGEPTPGYYATAPLELAAPWHAVNGAVKWYIDLVGIGSYNSVSMPCEKVAFGTTGQNILLMRYYNMDHVSQAVKALLSRSNATDWTYINLANINPKLNIGDYRPRASFENKNVFFNKHLLQEGAPNIVTCSFGHNAHTTRCFNWVSAGYYDEYIWLSEDGTTFNDVDKFQSFKAGDARSANGKNWDNAIYNRIRNITTDGTAFTVHKFIKDFEEPTVGTTKTWYYKVGRDGAYTEVRSFTLRNRADVITNGFNFLQVTDQQGFNGEEYETWRLSAEYIDQDKGTNPYDFCINTGDATQNGNRINEWLDYFEAGKEIFKDTEQMYTVGNNDLCPELVTELGIGDDLSKMNPINVQYFFTFEHPYDIPMSNGTYVPCVYSFVYGNTYFLSMNSEITESAKTILFGSANTYADLKTWCDSDLLSHIGDTDIEWRVAFCHESPFTIMTTALVSNYLTASGDTYTKDLSVTRGGSHLNTVGSYWFSQFLQNNGFKLCLCGHKHTFSNTRYLREDPLLTMEPIIYDPDYIPDEGSGATYPAWYQGLSLKGQMCCQLTNDPNLNYVRYVMSQATGYKLTSNKELPTVNIPWLLEYYPIASEIATVANAGQQFSHYMIWNIGNGTEVELYNGTPTASRARIKGLSYKIVLDATPTTKWAYKYNVPITLDRLGKRGGNGSINPDNNIIIEKTL